MTSEHANASSVPTDHSYVANLWEYPELTIAMFGIQVSKPEAGEAYYSAGIDQEVRQAMAAEPGMLCMREFQEGNGGVLLQYWRSHKELADFSRRMPHMAWWKWLVQHEGNGLSFYHEIYQCKTAEAIFETGMPATGPGTFCSTSPVEMGSARSQQRQQRFQEAAKA